MAFLPSDLGTSTGTMWNIPKEISDRPDINRVRVWRSTTGENSGYTLLDTLTCTPGPGIVSQYVDSTVAVRSAAYLVTFAVAGATGTDPLAYESSYNTAYYAPLPKELRLLESVKRAMPDVIVRSGVGLSDSDYMVGLYMAIQVFNTYPPQTYFTLQNFPRTHEYFLIGLAQLFTIASRFLPISIRDWNYSEPGGVVMQVDRGAKMTQALQIIGNTYTAYLPMVKLDFSDSFSTGVGTTPLAIGMGGGPVSRGILNILDLFTSVAR